MEKVKLSTSKIVHFYITRRLNTGPTDVFVVNNTIIDFAFFVFERTKHQPRRNLRSYLVLQRLCNEAALSPGIDAFWY